LKLLLKDNPDISEPLIYKTYEDLTREILREQLFSTGKRIDGRAPDGIRNITCKVGILPRTHGSGLFTRGETQALAITTFGTTQDEQKVESLLEGETFQDLLLHYNFPPSLLARLQCSAEPPGVSRHGNLALRAITPFFHPMKIFPIHKDRIGDT